MCLLAVVAAGADEKRVAADDSAPPAFSRISNLICSGGAPDDHGFEFLAAQGIKTVVSVDGAKPDLEAARAAGLRYVHLPIGYDGVPVNVQAALGELVAAGKPLYIHCHHGKHRGPAAAAIAAMIEGSLNHEEALVFVAKAGMDKDYAGLWRDVGGFKGVPAGVKPAPLVESAEVKSITRSMIEIDKIHDQLAAQAKRNWVAESASTKFKPADQAMLLAEALRETGRHAEDPKLITRFHDAEALASNLHAALKASKPDHASEVLARLEMDCRSCHQKFRN